MAFKLRNKSPLPKVSDSDFFTDNMREGFGAGKYGSYSNPSLKPETYSNSVIIDSDFGLDTNTAKAMTTSRDVPDMTNKIEYPKVKSRTPGASPDLESKIKTAESRGNLKRAARLEGRQDRRIERQTEGAERIKARQAEKTAKVKKRQEDKTKKSIDTSTDGSNLQMKNDSPAKFFGGIAAATLGRKSSSGGGFDRAKYERLAQRGGAFGNLAQQVLDQNPVADPATVAGAAPVAPVAPIADMSAGATIDGGAIDQANPFEGKTFKIEPTSPTAMKENETTYDPPTPANMMGNAKPMFNAPVQASAEAIYGSPAQRQMSMSPLNSYENPQTVIDRSHGYVGRKAAEAFGKISEAAIKEAKGDNEDENE